MRAVNRRGTTGGNGPLPGRTSGESCGCRPVATDQRCPARCAIRPRDVRLVTGVDTADRCGPDLRRPRASHPTGRTRSAAAHRPRPEPDGAVHFSSPASLIKLHLIGLFIVTTTLYPAAGFNPPLGFTEMVAD